MIARILTTAATIADSNNRVSITRLRGILKVREGQLFATVRELREQGRWPYAAAKSGGHQTDKGRLGAYYRDRSNGRADRLALLKQMAEARKRPTDTYLEEFRGGRLSVRAAASLAKEMGLEASEEWACT